MTHILIGSIILFLTLMASLPFLLKQERNPGIPIRIKKGKKGQKTAKKRPKKPSGETLSSEDRKDMMDSVRNITRENPDHVAGMIRNWMEGDQKK